MLIPVSENPLNSYLNTKLPFACSRIAVPLIPLSEIFNDSLLESTVVYFIISLLTLTNPSVTGFPSNSANGNVAFAPLAGSSSSNTLVDNPIVAFNITG